MDTTRIIYFGTAPFAVPSLAALASDDGRYEIVAVVSQPDRPAGRKGELKESAVTAFARENYLDLFQPESVKDDTFIAALRDLRPDIFVVAAYGRIIPKKEISPMLHMINLVSPAPLSTAVLIM